MNAFQIFGLEPMPAIDAELLKEKFLELSASLHPDVGGAKTAAAFAELNQAYKILASDRLRLKYLLELSGVNDPGSISAVPTRLGDLFMRAGGLLSASNLLIKTKNKAEGVLELASLQPEILEKVDELQQLAAELGSMRIDLRNRVARLSHSWQNSPENIRELNGIYLEFSYVEKWIDQVQEKAFVLSE